MHVWILVKKGECRKLSIDANRLVTQAFPDFDTGHTRFRGAVSTYCSGALTRLNLRHGFGFRRNHLNKGSAMFLMLANIIRPFFSKSPAVKVDETALPQAVVVEKNADEIIEQLMNLYRKIRAKSRNERFETDRGRSLKKTSNHLITANDIGVFVMRDDEGRVIKTRDAMRRTREYRYDENGRLEVNKFGVWNKLENARVSETGTLIWRNTERETYECLDGTIIIVCFGKENLIAQNDRTGEEITISLRGSTRHRFKMETREIYRVYKDGVLQSETVSFEESQVYTVRTMAEEAHQLPFVSRAERKFENGKISRESFNFNDSRNGQKAVRLCLHLPSGELHLNKVRNVLNIYIDGVLTETIFELSEPACVSRDKEGNVSLIRGISKVRSFQVREGINTVVFIDGNGDENVYFPGV